MRVIATRYHKLARSYLNQILLACIHFMTKQSEQALDDHSHFGDIRGSRAIPCFLRHGFKACASEWRLIASIHNLRKLHGHQLR